MNFDRINEQLQKIKTTKKIEDIHTLVGFLVEPFGITDCNPEELFMHASVQREVSRFVPAQGFRNQASAYIIPHGSGLPLDIKLFWVKKTTKANLSWMMALTPNYEDNPETNTNLNIGIDIVISENAESIYIVLSNSLKARVLELNGSLSLTQQEIFANWVKIGKTINPESENFKPELHKLLWKSFDFEPINRKFYLQLVEQFDHLVGHLKNKIDEESAKMFAVRLIGRTLFLWFLRKKEFINSEKEYFTVTGDADQTDYYREKLEPLFFDVLNTEMKSRDYSDTITPFLNGGLFEPIDTDFYKDSKLTFPTGFFTQFFNILNHYNFTVDEGTSEYEQVAVDPEMLGRVFENLLASLNDETGNQARKSKGAFYTPREIVDYMCEQSLIEYLKTKLPDTANRDRRIEELVTMDEATFREQDHNKRRDWKKDLGQEQVVQALDELKILDPAVGSGAFPMGMLNLLVKVYTRIDTALEKDLAQLKRDILSRSLYGVDIDQMAIQISRLRAWLSILVDMENLKKVEPLPNLDFKFVCANTLIPLDDWLNGLFDGDINLKDNLIKLRDQYYAATRKIDKEKIRKEYLKLINTGSLFASQRELQLKDYNPFNPLNSSGFYDPTLMHGVDAFDVVIGNPPYFLYQGHNKSEIDVLKNISIYDKSQGGKLNAFKLFLARGSNLSKKNGLLNFIFQNSFLSDNGSKKIRQFFLNDQRIIKIDSFPERDSLNKRVFEAVKMSVCIMLSKNIKKDLYDFDLYVWGDKYKKSGWNVSFSNKELLEYDAASQQIPYLQEKEKNLFKKFFIRTDTEKIKCYEGELNMTFHKHLFTKDASCPKIMKGAQIQRYYVTDNMSQGELEYLNEDQYLQNNRGEKSMHHMHNRIAIQGISGVNDKVRIISTMVTSGIYLANSCNYIVSIPEGYSIYSVLGILNSRFINYIFKKTSTNSNVNTYEISNLNFIKSDNKNSGQIKKIDQNVFNILNIKENNFKISTLDLESQIDELVMDLYGLNEEEKEIIRNS